MGLQGPGFSDSRDPIFSDSRDQWLIIFSDSRGPLFKSRDSNQVDIGCSQPFRWKEPNQDLQFCWRVSLKIFNTNPITQNIRRFIERVLRVEQRVPGSRMRPSEPELRTTGLMNWIDSHSRVNEGVTVGRCRINRFLQTIWYCWHIFNSLQHALNRFLLHETEPEWKLALNNTEVLLLFLCKPKVVYAASEQQYTIQSQIVKVSGHEFKEI